jgi:hypothetical protein
MNEWMLLAGSLICGVQAFKIKGDTDYLMGSANVLWWMFIATIVERIT